MKRVCLGKWFQNLTRSQYTPKPRYLSKLATSSQHAVDYCSNIVKQHDYENFLATLLMSKSMRYPTMVLRAFNVEISRIQDQTTDAHTAAMRLQFWRDTVRAMYKTDQSLKSMPHNPIAQELFKLCCCYPIPLRQLDKLITSRKALLKSKFFLSLDDLDKYSEESVSPIYYSILAVAKVADVHADHAASHLGKAQGITNLLRSIHVSNRHRIVTLPMNMLMEHRVSQENVLRGVDDLNMRNAVFQIASQANSHLEKARNIKVPKQANQIFLPAASVSAYLTKLQECHFNVFDPTLRLGNAMLPVRLYYNRLRNKY